MGRLIDEDDLLNLLKDEDRHGYLDVSDIKNVPTAFDIKKVILKLVKEISCYHSDFSEYRMGYYVAIYTIIDIMMTVEKGGIDER